MDFRAKLRAVADRWIDVHSRGGAVVSLRTLGRRAVGNSKLFDRPDMTVSTFEVVRDFLADPVNWPLALVPADAAETLGRLGRPVAESSVLEVEALAA